MNTAAINTRSPFALAALGLALTAAGFGIAPSASADPWTHGGGNRFGGTPSHAVAEGNVVDVRVKVTGAGAPLYFKPGNSDRHYFQAF